MSLFNHFLFTINIRQKNLKTRAGFVVSVCEHCTCTCAGSLTMLFLTGASFCKNIYVMPMDWPYWGWCFQRSIGFYDQVDKRFEFGCLGSSPVRLPSLKKQNPILKFKACTAGTIHCVHTYRLLEFHYALLTNCSTAAAGYREFVRCSYARRVINHASQERSFKFVQT